MTSTAATDTLPPGDQRPHIVLARACPTCGRTDTHAHHVPLVGTSHHVHCCPRTCGRPWAGR